MKYLKYCENSLLGEFDYEYNQYYDHAIIGIVEGQPKHGPTVICFKNPDTGLTRTVYTGKNIYKEDESPIQYTWRYEESYNGHPAIIVNFSRIDSKYVNNIVCLESNNMCKGGYTVATINKYNNIKLRNNNRALNVLKNHHQLNNETKGITWYRLGDLNLNTDYPIFITVTHRYCLNASRIARRSTDANIPNDWEVRINVRPTIRGSFDTNTYRHIVTGPDLFRHTSQILAKEYISIKFPYRDIFQV